MEILSAQANINHNVVLDNGTPDDGYITYFISYGFFMFYYGYSKSRDLKGVLKRYKNRFENGHNQKVNAIFNKALEVGEGEPVILYMDTVDSKEEAKIYIKEHAEANRWAINLKDLTEEQTKPREPTKKKSTPKKSTPKKSTPKKSTPKNE